MSIQWNILHHQQQKNKILMRAIALMNLENLCKEKKLMKKDHILYDSIYKKYSQQTNLQRRQVDSWLPRNEGREIWVLKTKNNLLYTLNE